MHSAWHKALFSWHMNVLSGWFPVSQQHVTATVPAPQLVATRAASPDLSEWEANALNRKQEQLKRYGFSSLSFHPFCLDSIWQSRRAGLWPSNPDLRSPWLLTTELFLALTICAVWVSVGAAFKLLRDPTWLGCAHLYYVYGVPVAKEEKNTPASSIGNSVSA